MIYKTEWPQKEWSGKPEIVCFVKISVANPPKMGNCVKVSNAGNLQPEFSRLRRFFYSAKILDGDQSISGITVSDWFKESE